MEDLIKDSTEELLIQKQKKIINKIVSVLFREDPSLYYAPTIDLSQHVINKIKSEGCLTSEELSSVAELRPTDVQILLGYASNCC